jgi:hypothetical protein
MADNATMAIPQAVPTVNAAVNETKAKTAKKKEHWLVEIAGGIALGSTMMGALALWTVMVVQIYTT